MSCENLDLWLAGHRRKPQPGTCNWYQELGSSVVWGLWPVRSDTISKDLVSELGEMLGQPAAIGCGLFEE